VIKIHDKFMLALRQVCNGCGEGQWRERDWHRVIIVRVSIFGVSLYFWYAMFSPRNLGKPVLNANGT
jgi:hypothetical protein